MTPPAVSVVVVSRGRPGVLGRCLLGLAQLDYPEFEVIVVADRAGHRAVSDSVCAGRIKLIAFDKANISEARNHGIAAAAGEVVAFIDDDSVPEPSWLRHLMPPFEQPELAAAGGFVRGWNGIAFQSKGARVDCKGVETALDLAGDSPVLTETSPGQAVKTEGTNCAFRADLLRQMGGFDPAFRYYHDETDLNLRLAAQSALVAIVPLAQVHHGFAASERRSASRVPRTLFDIGASTALLLRKHAPDETRRAFVQDSAAQQRRRLLRHMVAGRCDPRDVERLLETFRVGWQDGDLRPVAALAPIPPSGTPFLRFEPADFEGMEVVAGRSFLARRHRGQAARLVQDRRRVSLFLFSPTMLPHSVRFTKNGVWEQRGGLFGRSDPDQPRFRAVPFRRRLAEEIARIATIRGIG